MLLINNYFAGGELVLLQFHLIILRILHHYPLNKQCTNVFYLMHISLYIVHFVYTSSNELYLLLFNMYSKSFERESKFYGFHSLMKTAKVLTWNKLFILHGRLFCSGKFSSISLIGSQLSKFILECCINFNYRGQCCGIGRIWHKLLVGCTSLQVHLSIDIPGSRFLKQGVWGCAPEAIECLALKCVSKSKIYFNRFLKEANKMYVILKQEVWWVQTLWRLKLFICY